MKNREDKIREILDKLCREVLYHKGIGCSHQFDTALKAILELDKEPKDITIAKLRAEIIEFEQEIARYKEALEKAQQDINWMLNNKKFLNVDVFDYIEQALNEKG